VPIEWSWHLKDATQAQRSRWEIIGTGQRVGPRAALQIMQASPARSSGGTSNKQVLDVSRRFIEKA